MAKQNLDTLWAELNKRQQTYLLAIYHVDQEQEQNARGAWKRGEPSRPAAEWRWMLYATLGFPPADTALKLRIRKARLIDPGTGSTFEALERRAFIECRYEGDENELLYVKLTPSGRKLARHALSIKAPARPRAGVLTQWQWEALVELYQAGDAGLADGGQRGSYGHASYKTWERLRDYGQSASEAGGANYRALMETGRSRAYITPYGRAWYAEHWQEYRDLYPEIEAPAYAGPIPTPAPFPMLPPAPPVAGLVGPDQALGHAMIYDDYPNVGTVVRLFDEWPKLRQTDRITVGQWRSAHPRCRVGIVYGCSGLWDAWRQRIASFGHGMMLMVADDEREFCYWWPGTGEVDSMLIPLTVLRDWDTDQPGQQLRFADMRWFESQRMRMKIQDRDDIIRLVEERMRGTS